MRKRISIRRIRHSLSQKLSLGILLLAMPIFVLSLGILYQQSRRHIKLGAMEHATGVLNVTSQRVLKYLNTVETATNSNDWLINEHLHPDSLLDLTRRIVLLNANVNGCSITAKPFLFQEYGRYFSAYTVRNGDRITTVREGEYEYFEKPWYKKPFELGKACWVDPFDDYNEGTLSAPEMITSYCKPIYDENGNFICVISSDISLSLLSKVLLTEKPYPNSYFMMLGGDGHIFIHPDSAKLFNQTIFTNQDANSNTDIIALGHEMTSGHQGNMRVFIDGKYCQVCYKPLPGTPWSIALVCPESDILKSYNLLSLIIVPLIIVGLLLIMLFCNRIVKSAIHPLNRLIKQLQSIAEGNFDEKISPSKREDAIGLLQNSFVTMQASLERHVGDIQKANEETVMRNDELKKANLLAQQASKQKEAFIQDMSHQIRTPLNIIMGFAQVLRDNHNELSAEELKSITEMMSHNTFLLFRMVNMLYDSSDSGFNEEMKCDKRQLTSCNEIARGSIKVIHRNIQDAPITFETTLPDSFCIRTNRNYLTNSLCEILYNSIKYSDGQHVSLQVSKDDHAIRYIIQDTGSGIPVENHEMMFEMFTKVNELSEGLGLGLPLSKRHVVNLGGNLMIDDSYREGCRIIIELPISD